MKKIVELKKILSHRISLVEDTLKKISKLVSIIPFLERLKRDDETSLFLLDHLPDDLVEEVAPSLLIQEKETANLLSYLIPKLPPLPPKEELVKAVSSSASGTASPYVFVTTSYVEACSVNLDNRSDITPLVSKVDDYSQRVATEGYLPWRLDKINTDLGKKYNVAYDSYIKCKNGVGHVGSCAIEFRDVLEDTWGGLVNLARLKDHGNILKTNHFEKKNENDRELIASVLETKTFPSTRLKILLDKLESLCIKLSAKKFGKNPLNEDFQSLHIYFDEWIAILDGISGLVFVVNVHIDI